jgi:DNA polymerase-3 subunit epsilon
LQFFVKENEKIESRQKRRPMLFSNFVDMNYVIVDVETTGGHTKDSKITELAMYKHDGHQLIDHFQSLVNPEQAIPEFIVRLTGITDKMVENAPKFYELAKQILEFCEGCIFVAHNVAFDYGMFKSEYKRLGFEFRMPQLCTVRAARIVLPGHASYSLGKICADLGIPNAARHRADGDAKATAALFSILIQKDKNQLQTFVQDVLNPKSVHPNLSLESIEELPNKTGIYKLYNEFNQLIYIGKSVHIKKRIEQHLRNNKTAKGLQMIQDICRVEYELTGSELIAMLLESNLIKEHKPIYNRKLRKSLFPYGLYDKQDFDGYLRLKIESTAKKTEEPLIQFTSKKEAQSYLEHIAGQLELCQKLCYLYPTQGACFHYTIAQCKGACVQEEDPAAYNARVQQYIDQLQFNGDTFFLVDKGRNKGEKSLVWIENGIYRGFGYAPFHFHGKEPLHWARYINVEKENRDNKTIVHQFMRKPTGQKRIDLNPVQK